MNLYEMAQMAVQDSAKWFPRTDNDPFFSAACMAGEVGEVLNLLKKVVRGSHGYDIVKEDVAEEIADVFTYLLKLAGELNIDLEKVYWEKRNKNDIRFSARRSLEEGDMPKTYTPSSPTVRYDANGYRQLSNDTQVLPNLPKQVLAEAEHPVGDVTQTWQTKGEFAS